MSYVEYIHIIVAAIGNEEVPADSLRKGKGCF